MSRSSDCSDSSDSLKEELNAQVEALTSQLNEVTNQFWKTREEHDGNMARVGEAHKKNMTRLESQVCLVASTLDRIRETVNELRADGENRPTTQLTSGQGRGLEGWSCTECAGLKALDAILCLHCQMSKHGNDKEEEIDESAVRQEPETEQHASAQGTVAEAPIKAKTGQQ